MAHEYGCNGLGNCDYVSEFYVANNVDLTITGTQRYRLDPTSGLILRVMSATSPQPGALITTMSGSGQVNCSAFCTQPATATPLPATATPLPATATPLPATATPLPATAEPTQPPTATPLPPTATPTPLPPTATPCPPADQFISSYCDGTTLMGIYTDGICGTGTQVMQYNSGECGYVPPTDTPTPPPTATPTPTPTPSAPSYDYYMADIFDCDDCSASIDTIRVAFTAGSNVLSNRFYQPLYGPDGYAYRITYSTDEGIAYLLTTTFGSTTSCSLACSV